MQDQAYVLRCLVREAVQRDCNARLQVPLIVVSGGKKGVGATTIASDLAYHLSLLEKRVLLVDANPSAPDMTTKWLRQRYQGPLLGAGGSSGAVREEGESLIEVLQGSRTVAEVLQPICPRLQLLPGYLGPMTQPDLSDQAVDRLLGGLERLCGSIDYVVADVGSGMSPWTDRFWRVAGLVLLVTLPEPAAVLDSYTTIKLATFGENKESERSEAPLPAGVEQTLGGKIRLVVNRCGQRRESRAVAARLGQTCKRFLNINLMHECTVANRPDQAGHGDDSEDENELDYQHSLRLLAADVIGGLTFSSLLRARTDLTHACHGNLVGSENNNVA